jgi:hypothetical protein
MAQEAPITTETCQVDRIQTNPDGTATVSVTWGYSDGTSFSTTYENVNVTDAPLDVADAGGVLSIDRGPLPPVVADPARDAALQAALRALVAGPGGEEQQITFSGLD